MNHSHHRHLQLQDHHYHFICIQVVIIITFPDRTISWPQITSITVSSFMTLWTAANLYQLQLEEATKRELENEKKRWAKEKSSAEPKQKLSEKLKNAFVGFPSKMQKILGAAGSKLKTFIVDDLKSFLFIAPLILTSLVFNISNIILGIINNSFFFYFYYLAASASLLLPTIFSPAESVKKMENMLGLRKDPSNRCCGVPKERGTEHDDQGKALKLSGFPAFNVVYTNIFCINRPISNAAPSVRHFMVGLYPLHFVVNMTALAFERFFSDTDVIVVRGHIFNYNNIVLVAMSTGLANLVLFVLFYYPNFFCAVFRFIHDRITGNKKTHQSDMESSTIESGGVGGAGHAKPWGDKEGSEQDRETLKRIILAKLQTAGAAGDF